MQKRVLMLTTSAFILACGSVAASAQQGPMMQNQPQIQQQQQQQDRQPHLGDWVRGMSMMGRGGMMYPGGMHSGTMMRVLFAMMDSDSDGTVSLQEFQAAHERIFKAMDINRDGVLTLEEIQAFMQGTGTPVPREQPAQRRRPSD
jgi:EF hand